MATVLQEKGAAGSNGRRKGSEILNPEGLIWERQFSPTEDPYAEIEWETCDIVLRAAKSGRITFQQPGMVVPAFWGEHARTIFAQHYLKGRQGTKERETSVRQVVDRVVDTIIDWALNGRPEYDRPLFAGPLFRDQESARNFAADLKYLLVMQEAGFNSPVWYNIGVSGVPQQPSACFILRVEDSMDSITTWYRDEAFIFKGGSGAGVNVSPIRSSWEGLSKGGWASGPMSFIRGADASAGTMKSGGRSRRAAKMVVFDVSHPDIWECADGSVGFIRIKAEAERINRVLSDAGFDMSVDSGKHAVHVQYQNANNSVRVTNEFMEAVVRGEEWQTVARRPDLVHPDSPVPVYEARFLWSEIAKAAWDCADPGLQMDTTVNHWHTTPAAGRINASNPCSEYMHLDESPCNLASTNLTKFVREDGSWETERYLQAVRTVMIAQTVLACFGDYPTDRIRAVATGFRQTGQGYTNLGAMLMSKGISYDSEVGRAWAAGVTGLMQAGLYQTSAEIAQVWGAYPGSPELSLPGFEHPENRKAHLRVANLHLEYQRALGRTPTTRGRKLSIGFGAESHIEIFHNEVVGAGIPVQQDQNLRALYEAGVEAWKRAVSLGETVGYGNAHMSVLAPMGTNGYIMGNDTTGPEPALSLMINKQKVSGDWMQITCYAVRPGLYALGHSPEEVEEVFRYVEKNNSVVGAPHLREEHYPIFDTSFVEPIAGRYLRPEAHTLMLAAVQPQISGAISKTVNLPEAITAEEVEELHLQSWRLGLKAIAIYRDNCKATQPMSAAGLAGPPPTVRFKLPRDIAGRRIKLDIPDPSGNDFELYMQIGVYPDGQPGEIFFTAGKEGSLVNGLLAGAAKQVSLSLQHGTPIVDVIKQWLNMKFEPRGSLAPDVSDFTSCFSILDLAARVLAREYLDPETRYALGIKTREERISEANGSLPAGSVAVASVSTPEHKELAATARQNAPYCTQCEVFMEPSGSCYKCPGCGTSTGCS